MPSIIGRFRGDNGSYIIFEHSQGEDFSCLREIENTILEGYQRVSITTMPFISNKDHQLLPKSEIDGYPLTDIISKIKSFKKQIVSTEILESSIEVLIIGSDQDNHILLINGTNVSEKKSWSNIALANNQEGLSNILTGDTNFVSNYFILKSPSLEVVHSFSGNFGEYVLIKQPDLYSENGDSVYKQSLGEHYFPIPSYFLKDSNNHIDGVRLEDIFQHLEKVSATDNNRIEENNLFLISDSEHQIYSKNINLGSPIVTKNNYLSLFNKYSLNQFSSKIKKLSRNYLIMRKTSKSCFPANTPIVTDQGTFPIQKISCEHTIMGNEIERVTRFVNQDDFMIFIPRNAFEYLKPSKDTLISPHHRLLTPDGAFKEAKYLLSNKKIKKVYTGHILIFDILLVGNKKDVMLVNNLMVETTLS